MSQKKDNASNQENSTNRPPIVVVMGHVDHGKTSLLDAIRASDVASREHGGITQSIGAYQITLPDKKQLTFIDTPGHMAFTKMRSHGAKVADIAILVVAANDSVMPQTIESIQIIKEAKIPFVVAINKTDLAEANVDKVIQDLIRHDVQLENYGGDTPWIKVSAIKKTGISELLDLVNLMWEMQEHPTQNNNELEGIVIESKLDKNRGPVASVIIRNGHINAGDKIYIDSVESKIRGLFDYLQKPLKTGAAGMPVEIIGLSVVPPTGSVVRSTLVSEAKSEKRIERTPNGKIVENQLNIIVKADTLGSLEAILASIPANVNLIDSSVGQISSNDVLLAKDTKSIVLGFNVNPDSSAKNLSESEGVLVRTYKIIYELLDEIADAAAGVLEMKSEEVLGEAQIIAQFPYEKTIVAGSRVTIGRIARGDLVKVLRGEQLVGETKIKSVRTGKTEATKVESGKECGILLEPSLEFTLGDTIQAFKRFQ